MFDEGDADSPSGSPSGLGRRLDSSASGGSVDDGGANMVTSTDLYKADIRTKSDVAKSLMYFALGIVSQLIVYVCLWCAPPPPTLLPSVCIAHVAAPRLPSSDRSCFVSRAQDPVPGGRGHLGAVCWPRDHELHG